MSPLPTPKPSPLPGPFPTSGEAFNVPMLNDKEYVDFILPNGVLLPLQCARDSSLSTLKEQLLRDAQRFQIPGLRQRLREWQQFVFVSVCVGAAAPADPTSKANPSNPTSTDRIRCTRTEFFDESKRLCDLHLIHLCLQLEEPRGNKEEQLVNTKLGLVFFS